MKVMMTLLGYGMLTLPFILAIGLALGSWWVLVNAAARVWVGAWIVALAFVVETVFVAAPALPLGINVSTNDLAFLLLMAALAFRMAFIGVPQWSAAWRSWLLLGMVLFYSLLVGLVQFGSSAGVEARGNAYFWMAGLYFASFSYSPEPLSRLWHMLRWTAWLIAAVVVYRWIGLKYGFVSAHVVELAGASSEFRTVGSHQALFLAMVGVAHLAHWLRHDGWKHLLSAGTLLAFAVVLQHRSVWVATLVALAVVAWHLRTTLAVRALPLIGLGIALISAGTAMLILSPGNRLAETLTRSVTAVGEARGTHTDRIEGWRELLAGHAGASPREWLLGKPYGTGYKRHVLGREVEYAPHNFYVQILLRLGVIGLAALLWIHFHLRRKLLHDRQRNDAPPLLEIVLLAVLAASLAYYIPYQGFYFHGALYGFLIALLAPARAANSVSRPFVARQSFVTP
jgi:hypothetical protein